MHMGQADTHMGSPYGYTHMGHPICVWEIYAYGLEHSNRTVTLTVHSPKYSNRRTTKKTAWLQSNIKVQPECSLSINSSAAKSKIILHTFQLEPATVQQHSRQPVNSSARVKIITLHTVQLEPVTLQQHSRQPVDSSARVKIITPHTVCDSSARFKTISRQFS